MNVNNLLFLRNLDKCETFTLLNFGFLFLKTLSDVVARLLLFGCFMYVIFGGMFSPWLAFGAYYGCAGFFLLFNIVLTEVELKMSILNIGAQLI